MVGFANPCRIGPIASAPAPAPGRPALGPGHARHRRLLLHPRRPRATPAKGGDVLAAALTTQTRVEDRTRLLMAGYQMYLPKPVDPAELSAAVKALARRR